METAAILAEACLGRTSDDLLAALAAADVWAERCNLDGPDHLQNPVMTAHGTIGRSDDPKYGVVHQVAALFSVRGRGHVEASACPTLGGNTDEILALLGYAPEEVRTLREAKSVR